MGQGQYPYRIILSIIRSLQVTSERDLPLLGTILPSYLSFPSIEPFLRPPTFITRLLTRSQIQQAQSRTCLSPKTLIHFLFFFSLMVSLSFPVLILKFLSHFISFPSATLLFYKVYCTMFSHVAVLAHWLVSFLVLCVFLLSYPNEGCPIYSSSSTMHFSNSLFTSPENVYPLQLTFPTHSPDSELA